MSRGVTITVGLLLVVGCAVPECSSQEPLRVESLLSQPVRPVIRSVAPPAQLPEEEIATPPPSPVATTLRPVREISVDTRLPAGSTPRDYSSEFFRDKIMADNADPAARNWLPVEFHWEPAARAGCQPLAIVEPQTDDGDDPDGPPSQSAVSIAAFFDTAGAIPLKAAGPRPNGNDPRFGTAPVGRSLMMGATCAEVSTEDSKTPPKATTE